MGTEPSSFLLGVYRAKEETDMEMACHGDTKEKKILNIESKLKRDDGGQEDQVKHH